MGAKASSSQQAQTSWRYFKGSLKAIVTCQKLIKILKTSVDEYKSNPLASDSKKEEHLVKVGESAESIVMWSHNLVATAKNRPLLYNDIPYPYCAISKYGIYAVNHPR